MSNETETKSDDKLVLTIRLIRSFQHRNVKNIVIRDIDKNLSIVEFKTLISQGIFYLVNKNFKHFLNHYYILRNKKEYSFATTV